MATIRIYNTDDTGTGTYQVAVIDRGASPSTSTRTTCDNNRHGSTADTGTHPLDKVKALTLLCVRELDYKLALEDLLEDVLTKDSPIMTCFKYELINESIPENFRQWFSRKRAEITNLLCGLRLTPNRGFGKSVHRW